MRDEDSQDYAADYRRKMIARFIDRALGGLARVSKKMCRCRVCGLSVFSAPAVIGGGESPFCFPKMCSCAREFDPTEFTLCPPGALYVHDEVLE